MRSFSSVLQIAGVALALLAGSAAHATYWNLFNFEGESVISADYVTYSTLADMLSDTNRTGVFQPNTGGAGSNVVGGGSNGKTYWNLFNFENESVVSADYVTYATLADMLNDTNRTGVFQPDTGGAGANVVGTGSNGTTYWNLFNFEGESVVSADYVTYASLSDMLNDTNRTGVFQPNTGGAGANVIDGGSNGTSYWNLFNFEGESVVSADYVTYATLGDLLSDTNRTGVFQPNAGGAGANVVGTGSDSFPTVTPPGGTVPEPAAWAMLTIGFAVVGRQVRRRVGSALA